MKLLAGPQANRSRRVIVGLTILTAGLALFGPEDPSGTAAVVPANAGHSGARATVANAARGTLDLPVRDKSGQEFYQLFGGHSWYVAPPPRPAVPVAPQKPAAPPLPFKYIGSFMETGSRPVYYLVKGDRAYDVRVGDTIDGLYTFDGDEGDQLQFTYLPLQQRQTLGVEK